MPSRTRNDPFKERSVPAGRTRCSPVGTCDPTVPKAPLRSTRSHKRPAQRRDCQPRRRDHSAYGLATKPQNLHEVRRIWTRSAPGLGTPRQRSRLSISPRPKPSKSRLRSCSGSPAARAGRPRSASTQSCRMANATPDPSAARQTPGTAPTRPDS